MTLLVLLSSHSGRFITVSLPRNGLINSRRPVSFLKADTGRVSGHSVWESGQRYRRCHYLDNVLTGNGPFPFGQQNRSRRGKAGRTAAVRL